MNPLRKALTVAVTPLALFVPLPLAASMAVGCGGVTPASAIVHTPEYAPKGQNKCTVRTSQAEPLIVEWPPAERGRLEADLHSGVVAVRYDGCEMKLLPYCKVKESSYHYVPLTRKADSVHITNEDDLFASLPMGAVSLEGKLKEAGQLSVDMTLIGRWESGRGRVRRFEMDGDDCDRATHIVTAVTVGAFTFTAGGNAEVSGGAKVFSAGAGGSSTATRETLSQDGDTSACTHGTNKDTEPPDGCGALLRIEVVPIRDGGEPVAIAPPPSATASPAMPGSSSTSDTSSGDSSTPPASDSSTEPASTEPLPLPPPPSEPATTPSSPTYVRPPRRPQYTTGSSGTSGGTPSGTGGKGTLGTVVAWSAATALIGGGLLGALGYSTATSTVGSNETGDHCNAATHFCDSDGLAAKSRAEIEAAIGDGLMGLGLVLGVTYFLLPRQAAAAPATVGVAPSRNGATLQLGGSF